MGCIHVKCRGRDVPARASPVGALRGSAAARRAYGAISGRGRKRSVPMSHKTKHSREEQSSTYDMGVRGQVFSLPERNGNYLTLGLAVLRRAHRCSGDQSCPCLCNWKGRF